MSAFNTYIKFLVQVQKTTNLLLTYNNENNINTDNGIKFTLFTECHEYDVTKIDISITQKLVEIMAIVTNTQPAVGGKTEYWIDSSDSYKLKNQSKVQTGIYKVTFDESATGWVSGNYYSVVDGVKNELNDIYYDETLKTIINMKNGARYNFENNNIIMYIDKEISLYTVISGNSNAELIENENSYYYFNDTGKEKLYLYVPTIGKNTYNLSQNGYYKLANTNTSDTDLLKGLYNSNNGELTLVTDTYNLICVNTKNIYMSNGTKKTVQDNTMYICDNKIVLYINNTFSYITFD